MLSSASRLGAPRSPLELLPLPAPAPPRLPLVRLPLPSGSRGARAPGGRRRGRAGRRTVMWRDSLCTAAGYAFGAGTRLRSVLSSRKLQP
ncbi:LOW QUALITY PROTEIN: mitochondrial lactate dehydrogenase regulator [Ictidomys tridecemlineatus]